MRLLGNVTHDADKTTTVNMLTRAGLLQPEIMTDTLNLFEKNYSTFGSFLRRKGLTSKDLYAGLDSKAWRVVGNRKVMWRMKGYPIRKGTIISQDGGSTPGLGNAAFNVVVSTDFMGVGDNLELVDRSTLLHVLGKTNTGSGQWTYRVKLVTNSSTAFCDPTLLTAGNEIGFGHTMFPELSEDASEKTTYGEWHTEFLTIQRMKHTISGSANATKLWLEHNGVKMWDYAQNIEMLERWAMAMEHQLIFGRATMDANDRVYVTDDSGRDLPAGNGLLAQGDPGLRYQYNVLTIKQIERVMRDLQLMQNGDGLLEVAVIGGQSFVNAFNVLMRDTFQQAPQILYEKLPDGSRGVRTNFSWYEMSGVRLYVMWGPMLDAVYRPISYDAQGNNPESDRAIFVSLGDTVGGGANVQLITLGNGGEDRTFVQRIINGMTGNGPMVQDGDSSAKMLASSAVDGKQVHILSETGLVLKNPFGVAQLIKARLR
jgi:hypothetical protein